MIKFQIRYAQQQLQRVQTDRPLVRVASLHAAAELRYLAARRIKSARKGSGKLWPPQSRRTLAALWRTS